MIHLGLNERFQNVYARLLRRVIRTVHVSTQCSSQLEEALRRRVPARPIGKLTLPITQRELEFEFAGELGRTLFLDGVHGYEGETVVLWQRFCAEATTVIDIGAHVGLFAIFAADANPHSSIYAFEPLPDNYRYLVRNAERMKWRGDIVPINMALSDHSGTCALLVKGASGSTLSADFWTDSIDLPVIQVPTTTLDEWCSTNGVVVDGRTIIKLDVETHEPEVLRGAVETLSRMPVVICEVLATFVEEELNSILPVEQWRFYWIGPNGPEERKAIVGDPSWRHPNYLIVNRNSDLNRLLAQSTTPASAAPATRAAAV